MKTRYGILVMAVFLFLFAARSAFAEIKIKAQVDKTVLTGDQTLTYKLTVVSPEKNLPAPKIADFSGFRVVSSLKSSNISFSAGSVRSSVTYSFVLAPTAEGRFKIASSHIYFKNKRYESESFEIEVKKGSGSFRPKSRTGSPDTGDPQEKGQPPTYTL